LDLTEALTGYPVYNNRTGSFTFRIMNEFKPWHERYAEIMEHLHGKNMKAVLFDDPDYFYEGRFTVEGWNSGDTWSEITIGYNVGPYKWLGDWLWDPFNFKTGVIWEKMYSNIQINNQQTPYKLTLLSSNIGIAPFFPIFDVSGATSLKVRLLNPRLERDVEVSLVNGRNEIPDFVFAGQESYEVQFTGKGLVSLKYRVGRL